MNKSVLQAIKFTLFSISAGIIQVVSFALLHDVLHLESWWMSYLPSLLLSVLWNFTFNRKYTFKSDQPMLRQMLLVLLFYAVFTPASTWCGNALEAAGWHDWLIQVLTMLANFVLEFLWQKFVVFKESK